LKIVHWGYLSFQKLSGKVIELFENSSLRLPVFSKKDRIDSWEFRKMSGSAPEYFKKRVASFTVPMIETHK
jgi:hypothetical protein